MKRTVIFMLLTALCVLVYGQSYLDIIREGDKAFKNGQYTTAIVKYWAAEGIDPSQKEEVQTKVNAVFKKLEGLLSEAEATVEKLNFEKRQNEILSKENQKFKDDLKQYNESDKWKIDKQFDGNEHAKVTQIVNRNTSDWLKINGLNYKLASNINELDESFDALKLSNLLQTEEQLKKVFSFPNLKIIIMGDIGLTNLPTEIGNLTNLTMLNLKFNDLIKLPKQIGNLTKLTMLSLENNQLITLPPEIGNLKELTVLGLENNQLITLPPEIGNLKELTVLGLDNNQLTTLPPEIGNLKELTKLNLSGNQFITLPPEIENLKELTNLYIVNNPIETLPIEILNLNNLEFLYLTNDNTNSAKTLALLLRGKYIEAKEIYLENQASKDDFLNDINFMEKCGIHHPDFKKVKEMFNKK
jgi:hypothetical protein